MTLEPSGVDRTQSVADPDRGITILTPPPTTLARVPYDELVDRAFAALPADLPRNPREILVALDVDGTLLTASGASEAIRRTIATLRAGGVHVTIVTGRGVGACLPVLTEVGIERGWVVASNGSYTASITPDSVEVVDREFFDPAPVIDAVLPVIPEALFAVENEDGSFRISAPFPPHELIEQWRLDSLDGLRSRPTMKVVVRVPHMERAEFAEHVARMDLSMAEWAIGWTSWMDVHRRGVTKGTGVRALCSRLGVPAHGVVAIGDGTNDIPMFAAAHHAVAMGGASEEVRVHADTVTGPVDHDGAAAVMDAIAQYLDLA